jgi:hypothetical protein
VHLARGGHAEEEAVRVGHRLDPGLHEALGGEDLVDLQRRDQPAAQPDRGVVGDQQHRGQEPGHGDVVTVGALQEVRPRAIEDDVAPQVELLGHAELAPVGLVEHSGRDGQLLHAVAVGDVVGVVLDERRDGAGRVHGRHVGVPQAAGLGLLLLVDPPDALRPGGGRARTDRHHAPWWMGWITLFRAATAIMAERSVLL